MASTKLARTPSSGPTDNKRFTLSFWLKRSGLDTLQSLFHAYDGTSQNRFYVSFYPDNKLYFDTGGTTGKGNTSTNQVFRDTSAWYHIVTVLDTTEATGSDRMKVYVNGSQVDITFSSTPTLNSTACLWNSTNQNEIGGLDSSNYFEGYFSDIYNIDGQALSPTDFGQTDSTGIWKPKGYSGSYGTNGFYLKFSNSGDLGADSSGNGNNFTKSGSGRQTTDAPSNVFATILPMANTSLSEGNLKLTTSRTGNWDGTIGTFGVKSGKWYHEVRMSNTEETFRCVAGWIGNEASQTVVLNGKGTSGDPVSSLFDDYAFLPWASQYYKDGTYNGTSPTATSGDIINIAVDFDNGKIWFGINGTYYNNSGSATGDPSAGTNESISGIDLTASEYVPFFQIRSDTSIGGNIMIPNFGQDGTFAGNETAQGNSDDNGYGDFYYAPPSGYLALCTKNLASELTLPIDDGSEYMNTVLWSGNAVTGTSITGVGFQPDWTWIKSRSTTGPQHVLVDSNRGSSKVLETDTSDAEYTNTNAVESFDSDGFTLGNDGYTNTTGRTYVGWNWKASAGTTSSNTDGSITSTVQANTTAGFSIVTYTGNATAGATIGHGLGVKPDMIIVKPRNNTANWLILHKAYEGTSAENMRFTTMALASAGSQAGSGWYRTAPTSSVFYVGNGVAGDYTSSTNQSGATHVAYCFAEIEGYSKFGKYTGNGSTDGTFVYTGFRPAMIIFKRTNTAENWIIADNKRDTYNVMDKILFPNTSGAENTGNVAYDFLSNGFKFRNTSQNESGATYIYMAFAENPFVSSTSIPVTAR